MAGIRALPRDYLFLDHISWQTYERLLGEAGERHIRFTYDRGELEIMTLGHPHENYKRLLGRLIEILTFVLSIRIHSGGSTTIKLMKKHKGFEPDECYWIRHEKVMRGKKKYDLRRDPPPDLAVEVDVSRSVLSRMKIFAAFKVPEIWRLKGRTFKIYLLGDDGKYKESDTSLAFPFLPVAVIEQYLRDSDTVDETTLVRSFAEWVRTNLLPKYEAQASSHNNRKRNGKK